MAGAFQSNAFQNNAFSVTSTGAPTPSSFSVTGSGLLTILGSGLVLRGRYKSASGGILYSGTSPKSIQALQQLALAGGGGVFLGGVGTVSRGATAKVTTNNVVLGGGSTVIAAFFGQAIQVFGAFNDVMWQKLKQLGGVGTLNDMFSANAHWRALDGGAGSLNDVKNRVLKALGYAGHLNDMEKQYWKNK